MIQLIEAKFRPEIMQERLVRKRIITDIDESLKQNPVLVLYGAEGSGKTTAAMQYAGYFGSEKTGYLRFDSEDNRIDRFCRYMEALMVQAGVLDETETLKMQSINLDDAGNARTQSDFPDVSKGAAEYSSENVDWERYLSILLEQIICALQKKGKGRLFILDQMHELVNPVIVEALARFFSYLPEKSRFILICGGKLSDALYEKVICSTINLMPVKQLQMTSEEIRSMFGTRRITAGQANEIRQRTEGWCGAVRAVYVYFQEKESLENIHEWDNPFLKKQIELYFWNIIGEWGRQLYKNGCVYPYITEDFCQSVLRLDVTEEQLERFKRLGLLKYDTWHRSYSVPDILKHYLLACRQTIRPDDDTADRAAKWYIASGNKGAAIRMLYEQRNRELLRKYLLENATEALRFLRREELEEMLLLLEEEPDPMYWYMKGLVYIRKGDKKRFKEILKAVRDSYRMAEGTENGFRWGEVYLNLLYENPDCQILEWMDTAEKVTESIGIIRLYAISGDRPGICFGVKELSELFMHDKKTNNANAARWERILGARGKRLLEIASLEYTLESNGEGHIIKKINEEILRITGNDKDADELLGYTGIMLKLLRNGHHREDYDNILGEMTSIFEQWGYELALDNITAARTLICGQNGDKDQLVHWMKYDMPARYELITRESVYINYMLARGYMLMLQYEQARSYFMKTAAYYESTGQTMMCARSLFGEAVSYYEQGERSEAAKLAARAITMGTKYKYINIYTEYGKTGVALIEEFQEMTGLGGAGSFSRKKKYYYGNVLTASYEGYHSILLRNAKKEMRYTGDLAEKDQMRTALTMTEVLILQYIGSGCSNKEIGEKMNIQLTTVKTHVYSIYKKLDVSSRVSAVNKAKELNII